MLIAEDSEVSGGAIGAQEASLFIGCFIQLATDDEEESFFRRLADSPRFGLAASVVRTIVSKPGSPFGCPFSKATHSLPPVLPPPETIVSPCFPH